MTLRSMCFGLLVALLPTCLSADSTALRSLDDRDDLFGWEAVGRLEMAGKGYCTATLIAAELVLTAAHCVFDKASRTVIAPDRLTFRAGLRKGVSVADRSITQIAVHDTYISGGTDRLDHVRYDVALLRLARPITTADADPFILHSGPVRGEKVSVTSYGKGRSEVLSRQRQCSIVAKASGLLVFDCDVTFGSSGAPVFTTSGQRGRIVSIISGGTQMDGRKVAMGMELSDLVADLKVQLRANVRRPVAKVRRLTVGNKSSIGAKFIKP